MQPLTIHIQSPRRQRGSVLIQYAMFLSIAVLILGVVDLGYSFYARRDLQRIADLAAMQAVQGIDFANVGSSASCVGAGNVSVEKNWPSPVSLVEKSVVCGEWNSKKYAAPRYFLGNSAQLNAAHVVLEGDAPRFIPLDWSRRIRVEAIAQRSEPIAAFQVGSQLLRLEKNAPLGRILTLVGLDVDQLTVLDAQGLANAKISPSGLLKALGVNLGIDGLAALSPDQVANLNNLSLLQIINASLDVISNDTLAADVRAVVDVIDDLRIGGVRLLDMNIPLLGDASTGSPGIFTFLSLGKDASPNGSALDVQVGIGELVKTAIMIGANGHALQVPELSLLNVVKVGLTVVEPPTIGVGPVGTLANSAQIRLNVDVDSRGLPLLGPVLDDVLGLRINLPIRVEGVSADARLDAVYCPDPRRDHQPSIDLGVESRVARISIGHTDKPASHPDNVLIDSFLPLKVRGPITTSVLETSGESLNLVKDETLWTEVNNLLLGDTVGSLTDAIFSLLGGLFAPPILASNWQGMALEGNANEAQNAQIEMLAELYLEETKVNGFYNVDAATQLVLNGRGSEGSDGYMTKLVDNDFMISNAIPTTCLLIACPTDLWKDGTFSAAFKTYTGVPGGLLDLLGISTLGGGYTNCAGLLSALLAWNACVKHNLATLLQNNSSHANLTNTNALINSLKDQNSDKVTCSGALCVLLRPVLEPVKWLLNGLGQAVLSPLLTKVLGLELGRNEVKALDVNCHSAQLVY